MGLTACENLGGYHMNLSIDVARAESEVDGVAAGWRRFAESAATPFQTYEWHRAWWDLVGSRDSRQERHIVCVRDHGRLVGLAPLRVERDGGRSVLRFLTESWADYQDVLVDTGFPDQEAVLGALLDHASAGLG
jgi:CelD/BcsL family acetyltransferase involved in cellulose biosynthesis